MLIPYSQRSPGSKSSGVVSAAFVHVVMPGVLVVEALAQVGAVLALREIQDRDQKLVLFTGIREARFRKPVVPGDTLTLEVTALRIGSRVQRMRGEAKVDGQLVADADIMSVIADRGSAV